MLGLKVPKIDDITFAKLVEEARNRISQYAPEWTDYNIHDPGITFIELLAWLVEMQIFYLDKITDKHKLKYLQLLGVEPRPSIPAKVQVTFNSLIDKPIPVEWGTQLEAVTDGESIPFETVEDILVIPVNLKKILTSKDDKNDNCALKCINADLTQANLDNFFYAFGKKPSKDRAFYLGFDKKFPEDKTIQLSVKLYENGLPKRGKHDEEPDIIPSASLEWEYSHTKNQGSGTWKRLNVIKDSTCAFSQNGYVKFISPIDITTSDDFQLKPFEGNKIYWLRCRIKDQNLDEYCFEIPPMIKYVRLNTVDAIQMKKIESELKGKTTALPNQIFELRHFPIVPRRLVLEIQERGKWKEWKSVESFENSGKEDQHFVLCHDNSCGDDHNFKIKFGDGKRGKKPLAGSDNIKVISYIFDKACEEEFFSSNGKKFQEFKLTKVPPIVKNLFVTLGSCENIWREMSDFYASKSEDRHYFLDLDKGVIRLGTGIRGRIDPNKEVMVDAYYHHNGTKGNVKRGTITKIVGQVGYDKLTVKNYEDASGGTCAETLEEAIARAQTDLKKRYRAVTFEDFEHIAKVTPGLRVARAKAIWADGRVKVIVVPHVLDDKSLVWKKSSQGFKKTICLHLDKHRLLTTRIAVIDPNYLKVSVNATVKIKPRASPADVEKRVNDELCAFFHPLTGYDGHGWPFGRSVYKSEVCARIEEVKGVDCIQLLKLSLVQTGGFVEHSNNIEIGENDLVISGDHKIEIVETMEPCKEGW